MNGLIRVNVLYSNSQTRYGVVISTDERGTRPYRYFIHGAKIITVRYLHVSSGVICCGTTNALLLTMLGLVHQIGR
jgi:hypothetical protein